MIQLEDRQVQLIARKYRQLQQLQQRQAELQKDIGDAIVQLCVFLDVEPENYNLVPPDGERGWRLVPKEAGDGDSN